MIELTLELLSSAESTDLVSSKLVVMPLRILETSTSSSSSSSRSRSSSSSRSRRMVVVQ